MEAIIVAGLAVVAAGGYYAVIDLMEDLGIRSVRPCTKRDGSHHSKRLDVAPQGRVKKMAGMNI